MRKFNKNHQKKKDTYILKVEERETIWEQSYLGKKGYTIPKSSLSEKELNHLYEELKMKPEVHGIQYGLSQDQLSFPVYRENDKKIYVPRFYGIERYGLPKRSEITSGETIQVNFSKSLRDYQENIVDVYEKHVSQSICNGSLMNGGGGIFGSPVWTWKMFGEKYFGHDA